MKQTDITDAIGELPEELIAPVAELRKKRKVLWVRWAALAACLCIALLPLVWQGHGADSLYSKAENGERLPAVSPENIQEQHGGLVADTAGEHQFCAEILAVYDTYMLVRPLEGEDELRSADKIEISFAKVQEAPVLTVGDKVEITYSGRIQEIYPARAEGVVAIRIIK